MDKSMDNGSKKPASRPIDRTADRSNVPGNSAGKKLRFRRDFTLGLGVAVLGILIVLFPPVHPISIICWLVMIFLLGIYPVLHLAEWLAQGKKRTPAYTLVVVLWASAAALMGTHLWPPKSKLVFNGLATNMTHAKGDSFAGIKWEEEFTELRLSIFNRNKTSIQNVDLIVQVLDAPNLPDVIWDMGQLTDIPGVELKPPSPDFDHIVSLKTGDGTVVHLSLHDMWSQAGMKNPLFSDHWNMTCRMLPTQTEVRLVLATGKKTDRIATSIHVLGTYELMPGEGSRIVQVNSMVPIQR